MWRHVAERHVGKVHLRFKCTCPRVFRTKKEQQKHCKRAACTPIFNRAGKGDEDVKRWMRKVKVVQVSGQTYEDILSDEEVLFATKLDLETETGYEEDDFVNSLLGD